MKFRKASIGIVRSGRGYKTPKVKSFLNEFIASDMDCAEVLAMPDEYAHANSMYNSIKASMDRYHLDSIGVCVREDKVYVFKKGAVL